MTFAVDIPNLPAALRDLIAQIPRGRVTTYAALAEALGSRSASRWVGSFVLDVKEASALPVHRIVRTGGETGLYSTGDLDEKRRLLKAEGIGIENGRVDLARYSFQEYRTQFPLRLLRTVQEDLAGRLRISLPKQFPRTVAGVDLSYISDNEAIAGYTLIDTQTCDLLWSTTIDSPVTFPYIPTFLAFRELPALLTLLKRAEQHGRLGEMIFVDGSGILHDRRMGIACMLGILSGLPSVGISKKLLCGQADLKEMQQGEARPVIHEGEMLGMAVKSRSTAKPIYISPGHLVDVASALEIAQQLFNGHRLPEPTYWADKLSRAEVRERKTAAELEQS